MKLGRNDQGQNLRQINYTADDLNHYTQWTFVPVAGVDIMGYTTGTGSSISPIRLR